MAFADGELPPARRDEVANWLASHPEAAAEVDEVRRLRSLWDSAAPPEPPLEAWANTLARMGMPTLPMRPPSRSWQRPAWFAAAVAAVLPLVFLGRLLWGPSDSSEPFQVAEPREVDIVSVDAHDADSLVGHPALLADLEFTTAGDVQDVRIDEPQDGWGAHLADGAVTMVVAAPMKPPRD
jgi:anti-sigma factor RsiW